MNRLISFIIPAYNAEKYISRCLDSIISLPINAEYLEIVVVDDCSSDGTMRVLEDYAKQYSNIHVLRQKANHRQGAARNKGVLEAKGKYVAFIDADDMVEEGVVIALQRALREELDICFYGMKHEKADGTFREVAWTMPSDITIDGFTFLNSYLDMDVNGPTRGVFKRQMILENHLTFVENIQWEDGDYCLKLYSLAKSIGNVEANGYVYKRNLSSTNFALSYRTLIDRLRLGLRMIDFVNTNKANLTTGAEIILTDVRYRYIHDVVRLRNLSKYSSIDNIKVSYALQRDEWKALQSFAISPWERLYLWNPKCAQVILFFICPLAFIGRKTIAKIRK